MCRLEYILKNLLFSKPAGKTMLLSHEREGYPSYFYRFQYVQVSSEGSLKIQLNGYFFESERPIGQRGKLSWRLLYPVQPQWPYIWEILSLHG